MVPASLFSCALFLVSSDTWQIRQREQYGITDGLIRMSIGMENVQDILVDLDQSLRDL